MWLFKQEFCEISSITFIIVFFSNTTNVIIIISVKGAQEMLKDHVLNTPENSIREVHLPTYIHNSIMWPASILMLLWVSFNLVWWKIRLCSFNHFGLSRPMALPQNHGTWWLITCGTYFGSLSKLPPFFVWHVNSCKYQERNSGGSTLGGASDEMPAGGGLAFKES